MNYRIPDKAFRRIAAIMVVCFFLVSLGAGYWSVVVADTLYTENDFARQIAREEKVDRGSILAANGDVLVETHFDEQGRAVRVYNYPPLAAVTGHSTLLFGRTGIESAFNDYLNGRAGQQGVHAFDEIMHEQVVGADVVTTIQPALQQQADALLGNNAGAVIMLNPRTGDVLALASHPTYDPNTYEANAQALIDSPANPTLNRVTSGLYTPGSIFKVVTLAGVLDQAKSTLDEMFQNENGIFIVNGFPIRDGSTRPQENAPYDLRIALAWSSNVTFSQLGLRLGPDGMREIAAKFGFGEEIPFDLPTEASRIGSDALLLDEVGLASTAFGQGELLVTPLQMAMVAAAVANDGVMMTPHIVSEVRDVDGNVVFRNSPLPWKQALSNGVAAEVREAMIVSARDGFARAGAPEGIAIGGKTGTAQLGGTNEPHAWFMGFAPAENPEVVVIVIVENGGAGGDVAAPIAKAMIQAALAQ